MNWTEAQYLEHMAKVSVQMGQIRFAQGGRLSACDDSPADPGLENDLQRKCLRYCEEKGWPAWHDWSRKKNQPGWPDLIIFQPEGRISLIELKSSSGKLQKEQKELRLILNWLKHTVHVVRSYKRFLEIVGGVK